MAVYPYAGYYPPNFQNQNQFQTQFQNQQQTQNAGFISTPSEADARNYPVAYGNSVTFKDENAPYIYVKTMGFSQMESPKFEKYRLVKEEPNAPETPEEKESIEKDFAQLRADFESEIFKVRKELQSIKDKIEKGSERKGGERK